MTVQTLDSSLFFSAPVTPPVDFENLTESLVPRPTMTDDQFWALVEAIGWREGASYKDAELTLVRSFTVDQMEVFRALYDEKRSAVWTALDTLDTDNYYLGGDSGDDLVAHVVGCGREVFEAETADPTLALARLNSGDYRESFSYCIPHRDTYESYTVEKLAEWGTRLVKAVDDARSEAPEWASKVESELDEYRSYFALMAGGDFAGFVATEEAGRAVAEKVETLAPRSLGGSFYDDDNDSEAGTLCNRWSAWNLYSDAQKVAALNA